MARQAVTKRTKLQDSILREVNSYLRTGVSDTRLQFVSITKVDLNNDSSSGVLYWDTYDSSHRGDIKLAMKGIEGRVRKHLAAILKIRHVPEITFVYDGQFDGEKNITDILDKEASAGKFPSSNNSESDT